MLFVRDDILLFLTYDYNTTYNASKILTYSGALEANSPLFTVIAMKKTLLTCLLLSISVCVIKAQQSSQQLKQQQTALQQEINDLQKMVTAAQKSKKTSLGQLAMLQRKLSLRQKAINNISSQIKEMQKDITHSQNDIAVQSQQLRMLKDDYRKSVVLAYKNNSNIDFLNFICSAGGFSDALKRIKYLRAYRIRRQEQADSIASKQMMLEHKVADLRVMKEQKSATLKGQEHEKKMLAAEKVETNELVSSLAKREKDLKRELADKQRADRMLRSTILRAISREEKKAAKLATANTGNTANTNKSEKSSSSKTAVVFNTAESRAMTASFEQNRGKLPWPVEKAVVKQGFGVHQVPGVTNIKEFNYGITIATNKGAAVKAVANGKVISVFSVEGDMAVLVQHGRYFTLYGHLGQANVAEGAIVNSGQVVGRAGVNDEGNGEIEFMILQDKQNLDPEKWLR